MVILFIDICEKQISARSVGIQKGKFCFSHLTYFDSDMIFQFFCSLFVVTRYDVDGCLNLGPSEIGYHVHLADHSTRVGVLLFAVLHRADESQPARNSCPRLPHSVDSRFGLYHVAVVLSFLRSPALQKFESFKILNHIYSNKALILNNTNNRDN